jgi:hypothetical protein
MGHNEMLHGEDAVARREEVEVQPGDWVAGRDQGEDVCLEGAVVVVKGERNGEDVLGDSLGVEGISREVGEEEIGQVLYGVLGLGMILV